MPKLTAAQDLMLDLLIARRRLGEVRWPISNELMRTIKILAEKGYVEYKSGVTEGVQNVWLTPKAEKEFLRTDFKPAGFKHYAREIADHVETELEQPVVATVIRKKFG